jgi:hypothetical protein
MAAPEVPHVAGPRVHGEKAEATLSRRRVEAVVKNGGLNLLLILLS